ncbi:MAG: hypothetical protein ACREHG_03065 [Candidatus Saccharimonadales bacterium]
MGQQIQQILTLEQGQFVRFGAPPEDFTKASRKLETPTYKGSASMEELERFVLGLARYYTLNSLLKEGVGAEHYRVQMLGNYLEGPARDWFDKNYTHQDYTEDEAPIFIKVIEAMHAHFTFTAMSEWATHRFVTLRQGGSSVLKFDTEL